jgi:2-haloacid dehalogenase
MLDFSQFRFLTFDCYGTLIDWETGLLGALRPILEAHGKKIDDAELLEMYGELEEQAERPPFAAYRDVLRSVVRGLGKKLGFTPSLMEEDALPNSIARWQPWPDTVAALKALRSRYKLAIISNVDDDLFAPTSRHLQVSFDHVVTAGQAHCYKPGMAIFQLALEKVGVPPAEVLHVGQSIYHDVLPAQSLGMKAVWVNRPSARPNVGAVIRASGKPDLEVQGLAKLAELAVGKQQGG